MSDPVLTTADVAELLRHPAPSSEAARVMVGRLVAAGLPFVPATRPRRYLRHQVLAWLESRTTPPGPTPPGPTPRRRAAGGGLDGRIAELKGAR